MLSLEDRILICRYPNEEFSEIMFTKYILKCKY